MDLPSFPTQAAITDPEHEGFDLQTGATWIYPTNYPTRDYQFNIINAALFKNTLVSLPTGLGKTFIAAVVMYNFYRWYPGGKIIFMAPTRPLVKQQIEACYKIMAIPQDVTAELTGTKVSASRSNIWLEKRVFFVTPQVLQNDLEKVAQLGGKIKCLVFDEAHRAKGNHAYCQVIRKLTENDHKYFRVLALSATPGGNVNDVIEVTQNLLISHLEFRTEESLDVQKYVFQRSLETVVVQLDDKLIEIRDEYLKIVEYYARTLIKYNIIHGNCGSLTKGKIFMLMKDFQNKNRGSSSANYSEIMRCLNICVTLYHGFELLIRHGLRNFLSFFDEHIEKPLLRGNFQLRQIRENVRNYLGPIPNIELLPDGTYPEIPCDIKFGHPKHYKLREILTEHFSNEQNKNTRVIVFFEYRESVMETHTLLLQSRPLIQPKVFLGQGAGVTQKTQIGVVKAFREGRCNTLLSTCIGEEGLDVGEVDLIVCFDISNKSPIRMVQRMGRTGRKRAGSVVVLVTEGREQQTLKDCLIHKNNISTHVLGSVQLRNSLYPYSPRLVPQGLDPECQMMFITVKEPKKKNSIIEKLKKHSSNSPEIVFSQNSEVAEYQDRIPETKMVSFSGHPLANSDPSVSMFHKHIEKLRTMQKTCLIGHSAQSQILSDLLCYADSKRFNIPTKAQSNSKATLGKCLKQGDIRNMFLAGKRPNNDASDDVIVISQASCPSQISHTQTNEIPTPPVSVASDNLFKLLSNYLITDLTSDLLSCEFCPKNFNCSSYTISKTQLSHREESDSPLFIPNESVVCDITLENIEDMIASMDDSFFLDIEMFDSNSSTPKEPTQDVNPAESFFEAPKSYSNVLGKIGDNDFESKEEGRKKGEITDDKLLEFFNLNLEPISEEALLEFFKLGSYWDIFESIKSFDSSQDTVIYSPGVKPPGPVKPLSPDISDLCDLSYFGLEHFGQPGTVAIHPTQAELTNRAASPFMLDLDQLCDLSHFGLSQPETTSEQLPVPSLDNSPPNESKVTITQMLDILQRPTGKVMVKPRSQRFDTSPNASKALVSTGRCEDTVSPVTSEKVVDLAEDSHDYTFVESLEVSVSQPSVNNFAERMFRGSTVKAKSLKSPSTLRKNRNRTDKPKQKPPSATTPFSLVVVNNSPLNKSTKDLTPANTLVTSPNASKRNAASQLLLNEPKQNMDVSEVKALCERTFLEGDVSKITEKLLDKPLNTENVVDLTEDSPDKLLPQKGNQASTINVTQRLFSMLGAKTKNSDQRNKNNLNCSFLLPGPPKRRPHLSKAVQKHSSSEDSLDDFSIEDVKQSSSVNVVRSPLSPVIRKFVPKRNQKRRKLEKNKAKKANAFLDLEAELAEEENVVVSEDEAETGLDFYEKSFVNDVTQNFDTQMHAVYLQSVRSPAHQKAIPLLRRPPVNNMVDIYSQPPINEDNDYINDSFCVDTEEDEDVAEQSELSQLTILERQLKEKKKRKKSSNSDSSQTKRKRIKYVPTDDSD